MQDGAPPHFGLGVRQWYDETFPDHWIGRRGSVEWAPRSPDLNPLDFSVWGYLKAKVYGTKIRDRDHLHHRIAAEYRAISPEMVSNILENLVTRLHLCLENGGNHFENIM